MATVEVDDVLLCRVLYGISCRNYEAGRAGDLPAIRVLEFDGVPGGSAQASVGAAASVPGARPVRMRTSWPC